MISTKNSSSSSIWKWGVLLQSGIFDGSFSQRINASFQYILSDEESCAVNDELAPKVDACSEFTIKDMIQKGLFIFQYLNVKVDETKSELFLLEFFR